jgi:putative hydrolase of the HAD superfamily
LLTTLTFDCWNTLYKSPEAVQIERALGFQHILKKENLSFSLNEIREGFKYAWENAHYQQRAYGREITPRGHLAMILEKLDIIVTEELREQLLKSYTQVLYTVPPEVNGRVVETLKAVSQDYKLALICNTGATPGEVLRRIMEKDGINRFFDVLVFSDEVGMAKPSRDIFLYTLQRMGAEPENAVHVGDDPLTDIIGAKKAGMKAVWLAPNQSWAVPEADYMIHSLEELPDVL